MADWNPQANDIFLEALDIRLPEERLAFLNSACVGVAGLRAQVELLLTASVQSGRLLDSPAQELKAFSDQPTSEPPGTIIGPYKLLEQIGEGGMGVVYMADQQTPVRRRVAIKIIKAGMDSRQVIARFEAERQALAMMDHPNISKMLDAGNTDNGRLYFVMELVKGVPIIKYCDEHRLSPRLRLELFISVCQAVQHAHQKGIIHRDLKPTNVLVADYDDRPIVKIIDFGVAKAVGQPLTDRTMFTEFNQVLGTIEYMSPEQAKLNQLDIDTRTDIYSLGVLLYELLTGSTPFDKQRLRSSAFDEMLRIIREEEPPKPSTRLSFSESLPSIAAQRQLEPKKLTSLVSGDLDWIVMKSLEKDRSRRYETATGLAEDIQRYLTDLPVDARRPTRTYRLKKFIRRNKIGVLLGAVIASAMMAAFVLLVVSNARVRRAVVAKDAALATARQAVDQMLTRTADEKLLDVPLVQPLRRALLEDALKFYQGFISQDVNDPSLRLEMALVLQKIGHLQRGLGCYDDSRHSFERSISILERLTTEVPTEYSYRQELAFAEQWIANLLQMIGKDKEAESYNNKSLTVFTDLERDFPDRRQPVVTVLNSQAAILTDRGDTRAAEQLWHEAINRGEQYLDQMPDDAVARVQLCWCYYRIAIPGFYDRGQYGRQSEEYFKSGIHHCSILLQKNSNSLIALHPDAMIRASLAQRCRRFHRFDEVVSLLNQAAQDFEILCSAAPANHNYWHDAIWLRQVTADEFGAADRNKEFKDSVRRNYEWLKSIAPHVPDDPEPQEDFLRAKLQALLMLRKTDQAGEAAELVRTISAHCNQVTTNEDSKVRSSIWLGFGCALGGDWGNAQANIEAASKFHSEDEYILQDYVFLQLVTDSHLLSAEIDEEPKRRFYSAVEEFINKTPTKNAQQLNSCAWSLVASRKVNVTSAKLAVVLAKKGTEVAPTNGAFENTLGVALFRAGNWQAAITALNKSIELRHGGDAFDYFFLAMALQKSDKTDEARQWYDKGVEWTKTNAQKNDELQSFQEEATEVLGVAKSKSSIEQQTPPEKNQEFE